jgi:hypothetical protein
MIAAISNFLSLLLPGSDNIRITLFAQIGAKFLYLVLSYRINETLPFLKIRVPCTLIIST